MEPKINLSQPSLIKTVISKAVRSDSIKQLTPEQQSLLLRIIQNTDRFITDYQEGKDLELDRHLLSIAQFIGKESGISHETDLTAALQNPEMACRKQIILDFQSLLPSEIFNESIIANLEKLPDNTKQLISQLLWAHFDLLHSKNTSYVPFLEAHGTLTKQIENLKIDTEQIKCLKFLLDFVYKEHLNLSPEQVVDKILEKEKCDYQMRTQVQKQEPIELLFSIEISEAEWEEKKQLYLKIENWVRENKGQVPAWEVSGPLNFSMTREEMKESITKKLKGLIEEGKLMEEHPFNSTHDRNTFFPSPERKCTDLTRLWGSEFLKSQLTDSTTFRTPQNFLIINNGAVDIELRVWSAGPYLSLSSIDNGYIIAEKIEGSPCARDYITALELKKPLYVDFTGIDNILRDDKGKAWVVDTEQKSFAPPELSGGAFIVQEYLKKRFKIFVEPDYQSHYLSFKIPFPRRSDI